MGLDQSAYCSKTEITDENLMGLLENKDAERLMCWRKHNRLEGWMASLWTQKGNSNEFNCVYMELTEGDIDNLEADVKNGRLPETEGFFFGSDSYHGDCRCEYMKQDLDFIKVARDKIKSGYNIYFSSWW